MRPRDSAAPLCAGVAIFWMIVASPAAPLSSYARPLYASLGYWRRTLFLYQDWRMFRAPYRDKRTIIADLDLNDGTSIRWRVPLASELGYLESQIYGRMTKWLETVHSVRPGTTYSTALLADATRYLDRRLAHPLGLYVLRARWSYGDERGHSPLGQVILKP